MLDYRNSDHLMLDGYNLIHAIDRFRGIMKREGMDTARARFEDYTRCLHEPGRVRLTIVYDGQGAKDEVQQLIPKDPGLALVFTQKGTSADEFIERIIAGADHPENIQVATNDLAIVLTFRTLGAFSMNAEELELRVDELVRSEKRVMDRNSSINQSKWRDATYRNKLKGL